MKLNTAPILKRIAIFVLILLLFAQSFEKADSQAAETGDAVSIIRTSLTIASK